MLKKITKLKVKLKIIGKFFIENLVYNFYFRPKFFIYLGRNFIMRPKIEEHIAEKISSFEEGMIFFIDDFLDFGGSESVKKALYRLETKDKIKRLSHGIYYKPKFSKIVGELLPSVEEIAQAIARRDKARIIPTGVYAENILGLTTQVPMKLVFLTDGASRVVKIDNKTIQFKTSVPKNLSTKGKISTLVIQALKNIKKENVNEAIIEQIEKHLKNESKENILHDAKLAPEWIRKIMLKSIENE